MDRTDFAALQTFVTIAEQGSLRAAARTLGVNPPAVSHQLKAFEARLGTALFLRSTRSITLTDAGRALLEDCAHLLGALDETLEAARDAKQARSGRLRITLPFRAWQLIVAPRLARFQTQHAGIELDLHIDEALTDIIARGFHAGIRLGDHLQDNMIAVRLSQREDAVLVASPDYLHMHGVPDRPDDLLNHACIRHRAIQSEQIAEWVFDERGNAVSVDVSGSLIFNDLRAVVHAATQGFGIAWTLKRGVADELACGHLVEVLPEFVPSRPGFHLYFPKALQKHKLLRAFIDCFRSA